MASTGWKIGKKVELNNSLQIATYRQVVGKEQKQARAKNLKELEALRDQLEEKNTYMNYFKSPNKMSKDQDEDKKDKYIFDQVMADKEAKMYCQKSKYDSVWDKNVLPKDEPKVNYNAPVTTNQTIGWRPPIDDMQTGFNRSAVCKRTFFDVGHLS